ncbi:MAG: hypothetical protein JXR51_13035 [Bacteroidales bacterium]|nr:hypothetical protein [Bacteroidales bacterium]MBN2758095.1 hypothetical protein [Bacteroidales bacterium]
MKDINFRIQAPKKGDKKVQIFMGGDLGVNNLKEVVKNLKTAEKDYENLVININDVTVCDLATIQLLVSLKNTCISHNKKISFNIDLSKDILELLQISGLTSIIKSL